MEGPVSIHLHEPDAQTVRHAQKNPGLLLCIQARVDCVVSGLPQSGQDVINTAREQASPGQPADLIHLPGILGKRDSLKAAQLADKPLRKKPQLIDADIGVRVQVRLCARSQQSKIFPIL